MKSQRSRPPSLKQPGMLKLCAIRPHPTTPMVIFFDGAVSPMTLEGMIVGNANAAPDNKLPRMKSRLLDKAFFCISNTPLEKSY